MKELKPTTQRDELILAQAMEIFQVENLEELLKKVKYYEEVIKARKEG